MRTTSNIIDLLRKHEGVSRYVYEDHLGNATIGVGRCVQTNIGLGLSDDEIDYLLNNDIGRCVNELRHAFPWFMGLNIARKDALISMCFNLGMTRLRGFKLALDAMARKDFEEAAEEFMDSLWSKQVGIRAFELTEMIRAGDYI